MGWRLGGGVPIPQGTDDHTDDDAGRRPAPDVVIAIDETNAVPAGYRARQG
jgi:hypothetical protein